MRIISSHHNNTSVSSFLCMWVSVWWGTQEGCHVFQKMHSEQNDERLTDMYLPHWDCNTCLCSVSFYQVTTDRDEWPLSSRAEKQRQKHKKENLLKEREAEKTTGYWKRHGCDVILKGSRAFAHTYVHTPAPTIKNTKNWPVNLFPPHLFNKWFQLPLL